MGCDIRDVANRAGVSIATVSRVINNSSPVSEDLKRRVLSAIEDLGFRPSSLARSMRGRKTLLVGMILPDISNPFFPLIARGAEETLRRKGISLIVVNSDQKPEVELEAAKMMLDRKVDGVLFTGTGGDSDTVSLLLEKTTVVFLDRSEEGKVASVVSDNYGGMRQMLRYLYLSGHRSMWYLGGPVNVSSSAERKRAIIDFSSEENDVSISMFDGEFGHSWGFSKTKALLSDTALPNAIVCANDMVAVGAIDACKKRGIGVPDDVSVTGFDDIFFAKHFDPPLTTVHQPMYELGREGARLLKDYITGKRKRPVSKVLEVSLAIRDSVKSRDKIR